VQCIGGERLGRARSRGWRRGRPFLRVSMVARRSGSRHRGGCGRRQLRRAPMWRGSPAQRPHHAVVPRLITRRESSSTGG
jgi:hypothetical protein